MTISFCSFSSGSSGNCYLVKTENTALLIDAGISAKSIRKRLDETETPESMLKGILITHEHTDHTKGLRSFLKRNEEIRVYANRKTWQETGINSNQTEHFVTGTDFRVGDISVSPFLINHDAVEPVGYSLIHNGKQVTVVTDTGHINDDMLEEMSKADILTIEANHDIDMLECGRYPWFLKKRVAGENGHLSNDAAGDAICRIFKRDDKPRVILLAHISKENNRPELAIKTVKRFMKNHKLAEDVDIHLDAVVRDELSLIYKL